MNQIRKTIENKTFRRGKTHSNCCVGTNGLNDRKQYADGFLEASELVIKDLIDNDRFEKRDTWIFPIVFNARHGLELTLKEVLSLGSGIRKNMNIDLRYLDTHDIGLLWKEIKEKFPQIDRRFEELLNKLDDHVNDYVEIDPTGQTFRYPDDQYKTPHLKDTPLINSVIFKQRFGAMKELLHDLYFLVRKLLQEYSLGTYTAQLSRNDLDEISKKLPNRTDWNSNNFDNISSSIRKEYNIGKNQYSKALNLIQKHRYFSSRIGIKIPLEKVKDEEIRFFFQEYCKLYPPTQNTDQEIALFKDIFPEMKEYIELKQEVFEKIRSLPQESIADIVTLFLLGRELKSCERYEAYLKEQIIEAGKDIDGYLSHYLDKGNFLQCTKEGLKIVGHIRLADEL